MKIVVYCKEGRVEISQGGYGIECVDPEGVTLLPTSTGSPPKSLADAVGAFKKDLVERTLQECGGDFQAAARRLRTSRRALRAALDFTPKHT